MSNSREVKDTLQLRQLAAYHLITKQQTETLSGEDEAMLNQYMGDPSVRGFVYEKIRNEARPEVSEMVELYAKTNGSFVPMKASGNNKLSPTELWSQKMVASYDHVAETAKVDGSVKPVQTGNGNLSLDEQEARRIGEMYNATKR